MKNDPENERNLRLLEIINILGDDYTNIYLVNRKNHKIEIYRYRNQMVGVRENIENERLYEQTMKSYIENNVAPEDRKKLLQETDFETVCDQLTRAPQFTVHYRVKRHGVIQYYYMKCARVGDAENFENVVFAFANEDVDVRRNELAELTEPGAAVTKRKVLIVEDDELNREILAAVLSDQFDVLHAENGEEGLLMLEEYYRVLSVVLLDICMPVCDGYEFLERRKKDKFLSSVPVIVMTGSNELDAEIRCLDLGAADFIAKPYNARVVIGRINSVIKLKESAQTLTAVEHDELTGLYTKQAFFYHAQILMRFKPKERFHLLVADIRDFKLINNSYGFKTGDDILCYLAKSYREKFKVGLLARYGSDQFVCMTYGDYDMSPENVNRIIREIACDSPIPNVMVKYGIYEDVDKTLPVSIICDRGFMALKSIRDNYDCSVAYFTKEMNQKQIRNRELENRFEEAVRDEEFVVYLQAKYDVKTEKIIGAESLVRWITKDGTMIMPGEFIPLYEKDGLIVKLDEYVFRKVCEFQRKAMEEGKKLLPISVNLSRASIHHAGVVERYMEIVKENGIPFSCVPIELTETATLYNNQIRDLTEKLVSVGFPLHMDDFGSGYSSLITLNELPFTTLKIDKSLIDYIDQDKGKKVVQQVINLAHGLDMEVIAEGVESISQVEILRQMECDDIQGFYYARPQPCERFTEMVQKEEP